MSLMLLVNRIVLWNRIRTFCASSCVHDFIQKRLIPRSACVLRQNMTLLLLLCAQCRAYKKKTTDFPTSGDPIRTWLFTTSLASFLRSSAHTECISSRTYSDFGRKVSWCPCFLRSPKNVRSSTSPFCASARQTFMVDTGMYFSPSMFGESVSWLAAASCFLLLGIWLMVILMPISEQCFGVGECSAVGFKIHRNPEFDPLGVGCVSRLHTVLLRRRILFHQCAGFWRQCQQWSACSRHALDIEIYKRAKVVLRSLDSLTTLTTFTVCSAASIVLAFVLLSSTVSM
jgi:hypothetical protein